MAQVNVERKKFLIYLLSPTIEVIRNTCGIFSIVSIPNIEQVSSLFVLSTACFLQLLLLLLCRFHYHPDFVPSACAWGPPQTLITQRNAPHIRASHYFHHKRESAQHFTTVDSYFVRSWEIGHHICEFFGTLGLTGLTWRPQCEAGVRLPGSDCGQRETLPTKPWQLRTVCGKPPPAHSWRPTASPQKKDRPQLQLSAFPSSSVGALTSWGRNWRRHRGRGGMERFERTLGLGRNYHTVN